MTAATPNIEHLRVNQLAAIEKSGWGVPFHIFRPRNLASYVFIWFLILGTLNTFRVFRPDLEGVATATGGGFLLYTLYTLPWIWLLRRIDRWSRLPAELVLFGFLWGGLVATFHVAIYGNGALLSIYAKIFSTEFATDFGPALAAPFTEELSKGVGILLLITIAPRIIRSPFDGLMLGAFVGLGFQVIEDVLYVVQNSLGAFGTNQTESVFQIGIMRAISGLSSHTLYSATFGFGLVMFLGTRSFAARKGTGIALMILAMLMHGIWDAIGVIAGEIGLPAILTVLLLLVVDLSIFYFVFRAAARTETSWVPELLAPEVANGTLTPQEVAAMSGTRTDWKQFVKHADGYRDKKQAEHVLEAGHDLAYEICRANGEETREVAFARSEVARVRGGG